VVYKEPEGNLGQNLKLNNKITQRVKHGAAMKIAELK
jgi:hypothetical protein